MHKSSISEKTTFSYNFIKKNLLQTVMVISFLTPIAYADQRFQDDVIVIGSLCVGQDCSSGENFNFDTIRMKENNLRIRFIDSSTTGSFPTRDWEITVNESSNGGKNQFYIQNLDAQTIPFTILDEAPNNALYIGNKTVGLGTSTPSVQLQIKNGNSPTIRLEQDGSSGFTAQNWDIGGNEASFFVRDNTNNNRIPFRIQPAAPAGALYIAADGDIGFETTTPDGVFDIAHPGDLNNHAVLVSPVGNFGINIDNGFVPNSLFEIQTTGGVSRFAVKENGDIGVGTVTTTATSRLEIKNRAADANLLTVQESGSLVVGGTTANAYYGLTADIDVQATGTNHATLGINTASDNAVSSLAFAGAGTSKWLVTSRNGLSDGGSTADRLAFFSKSVTELFTIHQNGSFYFGNSPGATNNTTHAIEVSNGAHLTAGGVWTDASSRDLKNNITSLSLEKAFDALLKLNPVTFSYKKQPDEEYVGFIAEEVPDLVATADRKGLSSMDMVGVLTKVVQHQQQSIEELQRRLTSFESKLKK